MKKTYLYLIILLLLTVSLQAADERPSLYGFSPAYPDKLKELPDDLSQQYFNEYTEFNLTLDISKKGKLSEIVFDESIKLDLKDEIEAYLNKIKFKPAEFNGDKVDSKLPVEIIFIPMMRGPQIIFPVNDVFQINKQALLDTYNLNGFEYPSIISFPSYFCNFGSLNKLDVYPYILMKLSLDETGKVLSRKIIKSTNPDFDQQLLSAVLYAEISPALLNEKPIACETYLFISFFPELNYPTKIFSFGNEDAASDMIHRTIKIIPAPFVDLSVPIRKKLKNRLENFLTFVNHAFDSMEVKIKVTAEGKVLEAKPKDVPRHLRKEISKDIRKYNFYPSINFAGSPQKFSGTLLFVKVYGSEPFIRISYIWD